MVVEDKVLTDDEFDELIILAQTYNDHNFNTLKLAEEATELSEVLIKSLTKSGTSKPSKAAIIEELGDFLVRMALFVGNDEEMQANIENRMESKAAFLYERFKAGTMGTRINVQKKEQ